jgi:hypothetical protein
MKLRKHIINNRHLREEPCSLVSSTRSSFTHVRDVTPFDKSCESTPRCRDLFLGDATTHKRLGEREVDTPLRADLDPLRQS